MVRAGIALDCRPLVPTGYQRVTAICTRSFHGKEGVIGSSPIEGFRESPAQRGFFVLFRDGDRARSCPSDTTRSKATSASASSRRRSGR
jgi:hypothetical protein